MILLVDFSWIECFITRRRQKEEGAALRREVRLGVLNPCIGTPEEGGVGNSVVRVSLRIGLWGRAERETKVEGIGSFYSCRVWGSNNRLRFRERTKIRLVSICIFNYGCMYLLFSRFTQLHGNLVRYCARVCGLYVLRGAWTVSGSVFTYCSVCMDAAGKFYSTDNTLHLPRPLTKQQ